ncbi:MAG: DUF6208 family protein [Synechococcales bacterium]|nr:DUF6208 family protein [Synechococcales bacterium]
MFHEGFLTMRDRPYQLLWEIPLAVLSFLFFKVMKAVIGVLYLAFLQLNPAKATQWRVLSAETLASPLSLPVLMTKGPRWNTHAIIGTAGPFPVSHTLALDGETIRASAASWTAAIYTYPGYRTVGTLGSLSGQGEQLTLLPGRYSVGLRYYNWRDTVVMPSISVDGEERIPAQAVSPKVNAFYGKLAERKSWFYQALHYYVYTLLKLRRWLPEGFVQREYLPVGAPETAFLYGAIAPGHTLRLHLQPPLLEQYDTYLTLYNRASLPLFWEQLRSPDYASPLLPNDGTYLLRIRPKPGSSPDAAENAPLAFSPDWITITTQP